MDLDSEVKGGEAEIRVLFDVVGELRGRTGRWGDWRTQKSRA